MKTAIGKCSIDAVQVGEANISLLHGEVRMEAKYALVDSKSSTRHGLGRRSVWSPNTIAKLSQLIDAMEQDILEPLFPDSAQTTDGGDVSAADAAGSVPGL